MLIKLFLPFNFTYKCYFYRNIKSSYSSLDRYSCELKVRVEIHYVRVHLTQRNVSREVEKLRIRQIKI